MGLVMEPGRVDSLELGGDVHPEGRWHWGAGFVSPLDEQLDSFNAGVVRLFDVVHLDRSPVPST